MKDDFDKIVIEQSGIGYGILDGNTTIFYIKTGNGGNIYGYNNKYLNIALKINVIYKFTVIVASNPININEENNIINDLKFIDSHLVFNKIYGFGHSNGGVMFCNHAYKYDFIKGVISVNAPLNINLHKLKNGISNFKGDKIVCVYGNKDVSYKYIPLLYSIKKDNFKIIEIDGADHNFFNKLDEFIGLPEKYLL